MIRCPDCDVAMRQVTARANPGSLIQLDQCPECGGIWCDKWELFPIEPGEAARLEPVDEARLRSSRPSRKSVLHCPRCTARLAAPRDRTLGPDLVWQRCAKCDGVWLNRGQFTRYKRRQKEIRGKKLKHETVVKKIPEVYADPKAWVVTGTNGMFAYPQGLLDSQQSGSDTIAATVKAVLQTLARMVLGL